MPWWTDVPALTPLVAYDALRVSVTNFLDGVGSNDMGLGGSTLATKYPYSAEYAGAGAQLAFTTPVTVPAQGVLFAFYKPFDEQCLFYKDATSYLLFAASINGGVYIKNTTQQTLISSGYAFNTYHFLALVKGSVSSQAYLDGAYVGSAVSNSDVMSSVAGMGFGGVNSATHFSSTDRFLASGIFSGTPTLAEMQALEASVRSALAAPPANTNIIPFAPATCSVGAQGVGSPGTRTVDVGQVRARLSAGFAGLGSIEGVVTVNNVPAAKQVRLFDKATGALVAATQSAANGAYAFTGIDSAREYFVVSHDNARQYNAVISDMITP